MFGLAEVLLQREELHLDLKTKNRFFWKLRQMEDLEFVRQRSG
jgi:hypothetical protein